ncbi:MAG: hypothetical protein KAU01_05385, partial [Candidatus Cloacimonetes bacterium]|nr:hypothetical protein [Candidatus Cloacimonadota bacterium]
KLDIWKKEGYCEYVSGEGAFNLKRGIELIYNGVNDASPSFQYLKYRLLVTYLLDEKGHSFESFINTEFDLRQLEQELREYLRNKYKSFY